MAPQPNARMQLMDESLRLTIDFIVPLDFLEELGYDDPTQFTIDFATELESRIAPEITLDVRGL